MIKNIQYLLSLSDHYNVSHRVDFAKGKYELTSNWSKIRKQLKR